MAGSQLWNQLLVTTRATSANTLQASTEDVSVTRDVADDIIFEKQFCSRAIVMFLFTLTLTNNFCTAPIITNQNQLSVVC